MLYVYGFAVGCTYHGHGVVAVGKRFWCFACAFLYVRGTVDRFGVHRYEGGHAVATVDVEQLASRAYAVGGIDVATVLAVVVHAPVVPIVWPELLEVVYIAAFGVEHFAE